MRILSSAGLSFREQPLASTDEALLSRQSWSFAQITGQLSTRLGVLSALLRLSHTLSMIVVPSGKEDAVLEKHLFLPSHLAAVMDSIIIRYEYCFQSSLGFCHEDLTQGLAY